MFLKKLKLDPKLTREIDYGMIFTVILIVLFGILNIYIAIGSHNAEKQFVWLILSLIAMYIVLTIDYNVIENYVVIFYWANIALLLLTNFVIGTEVNGARAWIVLGPVQFQPSELAKIAMIFMVGKKLQDFDGKINNLKNFCIIAMYIALTALCIVIQRDMGMLMVVFFIALGIVFCAGLDWRVIVGGLFGVAVSISLVWNSGLIKPYQKGRLISFLNPEADPTGDGMQVTRALIGIGSGGIFGKGISEKGYSDVFVPENHTDMIFTVLAEHWGLIGGVLLLLLYSTLIFKMIKIAKESKDIFGSVICVGIASYFIFAIVQNIGMNIAMLPVTGITLPLVSYGGSSLLTTIASIGLVLNVGMRKKKIQF